MAVRLYEENEVHRCNTCGLTCRVTFGAVPIEELRCCGVDMDLIGIQETNDGLDLSTKLGEQEPTYTLGQIYTCSICGIDVTILNESRPKIALDCCGQGMELRT